MNLIRSKSLFLSLVVLGLACVPLRSEAAYDMYLSLAGIPGEATNDLIAVSSFSFGMSNPGSIAAGGGPGAVKANFSDLGISKWLDISSPVLALDCAQGTIIKTAILTVVDSNSGNALYTINLGNVNISSVSNSGAGGGSRPAESISLSFQTIEWKYVPLDSSGKTIGSPVIHRWNVATNTGD
jgi:type VI secretion system secreted protein Hcp